MLKNTKFLVVAVIIMLSMVLAACGSSNNEDSNTSGDSTSENSSEDNAANNNDSDQSNSGKMEIGQKEITIPYVSWPSAVASTNVIKVVLENQGYNVNLKQVNSGAMYSSISGGSADTSVCIWLPNTDAKYWKKYKDNLNKLGPNVEGTPLGLVVPKYMKKVNSIKDLAKNTNSVGDKTDWTITGIEPGAGQMKTTKNEVMTSYGMDKWNLQSSSSAAMATSLGEAIKNKEPIVVTLWSPHWAFSKWDLKYLKDPKNGYGESDNINTITRQGFKEDAPRAYKILDQFKLTKDQLAKVMVKINKGMEAPKAAKEWVQNNQDTVSKWTKGIK